MVALQAQVLTKHVGRILEPLKAFLFDRGGHFLALEIDYQKFLATATANLHCTGTGMHCTELSPRATQHCRLRGYQIVTETVDCVLGRLILFSFTARGALVKAGTAIAAAFFCVQTMRLVPPLSPRMLLTPTSQPGLSETAKHLFDQLRTWEILLS